MTRALYVAAGGGGDAIGAALIASNGDRTEPVAIATLAWERLMVDPLPGPRSVNNFTGLITHGPGCLEIVEHTRLIPPAGSMLPALAAALPVRLFLLDPTQGALGLARQLRAISRHISADRIVLVDVGGDLITDGTEPGLRSPFADAFVLAGCLASELPTTPVVCGPGLDGELDQDHVIRRGRLLGSSEPARLSAQHAEGFRSLFRWHPSEASGLLVASAMGRRGLVEMRDAGSQVPLTPMSATVLTLPPDAIADINPFCRVLAYTQSLDEAEELLTRFHVANEIEYERVKAERLPDFPEGIGFMPSFAQIEAVSRAAHERGADFVTVRRLAELTGHGRVSSAMMVKLLSRIDPQRLDPPLWEVRPYPAPPESPE